LTAHSYGAQLVHEHRGETTARLLVQMGFTRVNLRRGMLAYAAAKLPVDRAEAQPTA
jgi:rhodanese-related sulfurtransferase